MNAQTESSKVPLYNGKPIDYSLAPYVLSRKEASLIESSLTQLLKQVEKFTSQALADRRVLARLGANIDELARLTASSGERLHIPFARFDFVFDRATGKIQVMELNTDGTSSWNLAEWVNVAAGLVDAENPNLQLSERLLAGLRSHQPNAREVVILDFENVATRWEQEDLVNRWNKVGAGEFSVRLKSPHDGDWTEHAGALVYRRAVSWQLDAEKSKSEGFLSAWRDGKVIVVGGRTSDVGMSKGLPAVVSSSLFPETLLLAGGSSVRERVLAEKNQWVVKSFFGHSGKGVVVGSDVSAEHWATAVQFGDVAQRKIVLPRENGKRVELGLYFINGVASGYLCRAGHEGMITDLATDFMRPVQVVER